MALQARDDAVVAAAGALGRPQGAAARAGGVGGLGGLGCTGRRALERDALAMNHNEPRVKTSQVLLAAASPQPIMHEIRASPPD